MYNLKDFKKNGLPWPLNFKDNKYPPETLLGHYEKFQIKAEKVFGRKISLKPNLLSKFFDNFLDHPTILPKVKEIIGKNIYVWSSAIFDFESNKYTT